MGLCQIGWYCMKPSLNSSSAIAPIAFAECGSTAVSMGALVLMERKPGLITPLRDWVARAIIYPHLQQRHPQGDSPTLLKQATDQASLFVKGTVMMGAGFVSHVPIQLALEGAFHGEALKTAVFGKTVGLAGSLGSILVIEKLAPNALPALQNALYPLIKPLLPKDERGRESRGAQEVAKLLMIDVPSSVVAGVLNYQLARKGR
jgi:hypothetical protein